MVGICLASSFPHWMFPDSKDYNLMQLCVTPGTWSGVKCLLNMEYRIHQWTSGLFIYFCFVHGKSCHDLNNREEK